jgi:outer membrane protein assembly factor BamB
LQWGEPRIACLDQKTGVRSPDIVGVPGPLIAASDELLFAAGGFDSISAYDLNDGSSRWSFTKGDWYIASIVLGEGKIFVGVHGCTCYCSMPPPHVYALDGQNGSVLWERVFPGRGIAQLTYANGYLYAIIGWDWDCIGSPNHAGLYALNAETGDMVWNNEWVFGGLPMVVGDLIILSMTQESPGLILALHSLTGQEMWRFSSDTALLWGWRAIGYSPIISSSNEAVYAVAEGRVYCIHSATGNKLWEYTFDSSSFGIVDLIPSGGDRLYVILSCRGSQSGTRIVTLNTLNGQITWASQLNNQGVGSPIITPNGLYYMDQGSLRVLTPLE